MEGLIFRKLRDEEIAEGHRIIRESFAQVEQKGISIGPPVVPFETYQYWHSLGEVFGLFEGDTLAVSLCLVSAKDPEWVPWSGPEPVTWLYSLATHQDFRGKKLGKKAVEKGMDWLKKNNATTHLYLTCICDPDFLPNFYRELGFEKLTEATMFYPESGNCTLGLFSKKL